MALSVAITGASGFLGRAVFDRLKADGLAVTGYSRRIAPELTTLASYADVPAADVIVHFAEISDAALVAAAGPAYRDEAVAIARTLAKKAGRLLYASSAMVYGDGQAVPRRVEEAVSPFNPYTDLKLTCEAIVSENSGTSLRLANLCGVGQPHGTILADILEQLGRPGPLILRNTAAVRDFLWIGDAAAAIAAMAIAPALPPVMNVGSGVGISAGEFATRVLRAAGHAERSVESAGEPKPSALWLDISQTSRLLDWRPVISIEQGIASLLAKE
jgi:nucleoside-diphosphate-sugar epimerase